MKVLFLAMRSKDTEEENLGYVDLDVKTGEVLKNILSSRLANYCEVHGKNNLTGAIMFLDPRYEGIQYMKFNNSYIPSSFRYLTPLVVYKDENIKIYESNDT